MISDNWKERVSKYKELGLSSDEMRRRERQVDEEEDITIKNELKQYPLFHVTSKKNLPVILETGLKPKLSLFTVKAYARNKYHNLDFDHEVDFYRNKEEIKENNGRIRRILARSKEELLQQYPKGLVFATDYDSLPLVFGILTMNPKNPIYINDIALIGIKPECEKDFKPERIAFDKDYISDKSVKSDCLVAIDERKWKKILH